MARLQILELPTVEQPDGTEETPFILVIDQVSDPASYVHMTGNPERLGARAVLVFDDTIDIPANDVPLDPDGYPIKFRIEPDLSGWDDAVATALGNVHDAIGQQFTLKLGDRDVETVAKETLTRQGPSSHA